MTNPPLKTRHASAVSTKLLEDHERLRGLIATLKSELHEICHRQSGESLKKAQEMAQKLLQEMNTHAACEDKALFPALSQHHALPILEVEHEEVLLQRAALVSGILNYSFPEDCSDKLYKQAEEFFDLVERHMAKEEKAIFPLAEQSLPPAEKQQVLRKMEDIRATARVLPIQDAAFPGKRYHRFHFPLEEPVTEKIHTETLLEVGSLQFKTMGLKGGTSLSTHWSPKQVTVLLYSGEAEWSGPDMSITMKAGDAILMDPKLAHSLEAKTDCRLLLIANEP
jgi:hemerythrin-like domain-containing protein/quercetin dioxygenase-like cupin family protein